MKTLVVLLLLAACSLAQNNSGTLVIAPVRPQSASDTFPSAVANEIQGGPFSVSNVAAMSNIPSARLVPGALAYVTNDNTFRLWDGASWSASATRNAFGLGATWLTNTNVVNFRAAIGLGGSDEVAFARINLSTSALLYTNTSTGLQMFTEGNPRLSINSTESEFTGNVVLRNQSTSQNGLIFVYRTNNEPFLGLANFIASNNTTLSNETLFRVGRAEATNQAAQFGFRVVRTNNGGEGFATFSVYGYNALMMIGPSDRSRTNTATNAAIEADIYTIAGSNRVMTLRDTNTGALTLHQDLGYAAALTNSTPTNTTTPAAWMRVWVGTNNYRLPLYQ